MSPPPEGAGMADKDRLMIGIWMLAASSKRFATEVRSPIVGRGSWVVGQSPVIAVT